MKTILCLTDFSSTANHAANYGYFIAKDLGAEIILCNIINVPAEIPQYEVVLWPIDHYEKLEAESLEALKKLKKKFEHEDHTSGFHPPISCIYKTGIVTDEAQCNFVLAKAMMNDTGKHD
jgi:nucleotide-binding universal stress UspA family protein